MPSRDHPGLDPLTSRRRLRVLLDGEDPVHGRRVAFAIQGLILLSVVSIGIETLPNLPEIWRRVLFVEEIVVLALFTVEYALRIYSAPRRLAYVFSPLGIIDFLAIAPSIVFLGVDTRAVRALRLLRVLRLLKLTRYVAAFRRLGRAVASIRDELLVFAGIAAVVLYLCASAIYYFEHAAQPDAFASIFHAMWWAVVTLTTVGYGDVYPVTAGGRLFTGVVLVLALGIIAVPTGLIASALAAEQERAKEAARRRAADAGAPEADAAGGTGTERRSPP